MKKLLACLLCALFALSALTLLPAASTDSVNDDTWDGLDFKVLYAMDNSGVVWSEVNDDYMEDWWYQEVPEMDGAEMTLCSVEMRGFALSPDGRYAFMGHLNGGDYFRGCLMFDLWTGKALDLYYKYDGDAGNQQWGPFSYAKCVETDDRGYVYVGFAFSNNYNIVNLGIAQVDYEACKMHEVSYTPVYEYGDPGDVGGIHVGVNSVRVRKVGDRYLAYVMTNYDYDALYCFDVTDPAFPEPVKEFGNNGVIIFTDPDCEVKGEYSVAEPWQLWVDDDGTLWVSCKINPTGTYGVLKIDPDGKRCLDSFENKNCRAIIHLNDRLILGDKDGGKIDILDDTSFELIRTIDMTEKMDDPKQLAYAVIRDDVLYVVNCSDNQSCLLAAALTNEGQMKLDEIISYINNPALIDDADATLPETDAPAAPTEAEATEAPTDAPATGAEATEAPAADTAADTGADATAADAADTDASGDEGGCRSTVCLSGLLLLLAAAAVTRRKNAL